MIVLVMGVSGSGKSTLGRALASALGWAFIEADDHHDPANVARMRRGEPLDDAARRPWLDRLHVMLAGYDARGQDAVIACSALKAAYRARLTEGIADVRTLALVGQPRQIGERLAARTGHFMPPVLLESQLADLELPGDAIRIPIDLPNARQVALALGSLRTGDATMKHYQAEPIAEGLAFPEGPRWHEGRLWFTDQHACTIQAMDPDGTLETIARTDDLPGGLGWLPDGTLLVVYMTQRRLMRVSAAGIAPYADLSDHASFHCNDMVVDAAGRVYAGNFGFDLHGGAPQRAAEILLVDTDGRIEHFADSVVFPNGSAITPDGSRLLVAETFGHRITEFALDSNGRSSASATWSELGERTPDGICLDAEGALWVASPGTGELIRVARGGGVSARCETRGTPYACMLGHEDRLTLYACTSETDDPEQAARLRSGRIEQARIEVPGVGRP